MCRSSLLLRCNLRRWQRMVGRWFRLVSYPQPNSRTLYSNDSTTTHKLRLWVAFQDIGLPAPSGLRVKSFVTLQVQNVPLPRTYHSLKDPTFHDAGIPFRVCRADHICHDRKMQRCTGRWFFHSGQQPSRRSAPFTSSSLIVAEPN